MAVRCGSDDIVDDWKFESCNALRRTAALRQRHARQLQQTDKDQFGVPVAATARPFSLWASPQKIGEASTGGVGASAGRACSLRAARRLLLRQGPAEEELACTSHATCAACSHSIHWPGGGAQLTYIHDTHFPLAPTGLGIHFASMRAFVAVALLLSLVAIYPLVDDLQTDRWAPTYTLVLNQVGRDDGRAAACNITFWPHSAYFLPSIVHARLYCSVDVSGETVPSEWGDSAM